jgi:hypothetical protein
MRPLYRACRRVFPQPARSLPPVTGKNFHEERLYTEQPASAEVTTSRRVDQLEGLTAMGFGNSWMREPAA